MNKIIEIMDGYFIEIDEAQRNYTLKHTQKVKTEDGVYVDSVTTYGHHGNEKQALNEFAKRYRNNKLKKHNTLTDLYKLTQETNEKIDHLASLLTPKGF